MIERTKSGQMYRIEMLWNVGVGNGAWGIYKGGTELVEIIPIYEKYSGKEIMKAVEWIHNQE